MKKIVLKNINLLDGTKDMTLQKRVNIEISGEKITKIFTGKIKENKNTKVIDLEGKYVVPGLINLHAHLPSSGKLSKKKLGDRSKLVKFVSNNFIGRVIGSLMVKKYALMALNSGVTTVRAVGGVSNLDSLLRDKINSGKILGPRLLVANSAIGVKGGHMDGTVAVAISSLEEAKEKIRTLKKEKVDLIKLMITGGVLDAIIPGHPAPLRMDKELVKTCVYEAHKLGLKVAAHVESPEGMEVAIDCGVDSIEHGSSFDESLCKKMAKNNQCVVTTLSPALPFIYIDKEIHHYGDNAVINSKIVFDGMVESAKLCLKNNIRVGLGTDAGSTLTSHYNFYKELALFEKYLKVSKKFAIYSATLSNAIIAGIDKETGSVEVGKMADLLIVDKNPLDNLNNLGKARMVVIKGKIIKHPKFKRDKYLDSLIEPIF